jgi:hypothetical protein
MTKNRRFLALLLSTVTASLAFVAVAAPAQAASMNIKHFNANGSAGYCVDLRSQDNITVQLWTCSGASEQSWDEETVFRNGVAYTDFRGKTGLCIAPNDATQGSGLTVHACGLDDTLWSTYGFGQTPAGGSWDSIRNFHTGFCMNLLGDHNANGTPIDQDTCTAPATAAQEWKFLVA